MFQLTDDSIDSGALVTGVQLTPKGAADSLEARKLFESAVRGSMMARARVQEAMTTSDFPILLGVSYGRELRTQYQGIAPVWQKFATKTTAPDFRERGLVDLLGGIAGLEVVPEGSEYKARSLTESEQKFKLRKRGARIPLTWEMFINDQLGAFRNLPDALAVSARETEDIAAVDALLNSDRSDINTQFFKTANGNAPANVPLTRANLKAALTAIKSRKGKDGRPLSFGTGKPVLLVPQALEEVANDIVSAREIRETVDGAEVISVNDMASRVDIVVNPWLDVRNGNAKAPTTWFILPPPNSPRAAIVTGFLAGHETPDLRVKADAGNRPGGGIIAPTEGSFGDDTVQYRVRHVVEGATLDPMLTYASRGA